MVASQSHGFIWESEICHNTFKLPSNYKPHTNVHDVPHKDNIFNPNENISLKTTGSHTLYCGDIQRFFTYDFDYLNTIIVVKYVQSDDSYSKDVQHIYEIDYTKSMHRKLFGSIDAFTLNTYVQKIKDIPKGKCSTLIKRDYISQKNYMQDYYNMKIVINPKVDSYGQRRVQCSIPNFTSVLKDHIRYSSSCLLYTSDAADE